MYGISYRHIYVAVNTTSGIPAAGRQLMVHLDCNHIFFAAKVQYIIGKDKRKWSITIVVFTKLLPVHPDSRIHINAVKIQADRLSLHILRQNKAFTIPSGTAQHISALLFRRSHMCKPLVNAIVMR